MTLPSSLRYCNCLPGRESGTNCPSRASKPPSPQCHWGSGRTNGADSLPHFSCRLHRSASCGSGGQTKLTRCRISAAAFIAAHIATVGSLFRRHAALMPCYRAPPFSCGCNCPACLLPGSGAFPLEYPCSFLGQLLPQSCPARVSQPLSRTAFASKLSRSCIFAVILDSFCPEAVPLGHRSRFSGQLLPQTCPG